MKKFLALIAAAGTVAALSACGTGGPDDPADVTTEAVTTKSSTTTSSSAETSTAPSSPEAEAVPAAAHYFMRCQLADGTGLMSDGSTVYLESCDESAGGPMLLQDGTSIYDRAPYVDPETVPIADGGTCPAAKCGYGHDADGNPNPSSGEIQTKHGCDEGYIDDATLCSAVNEKYDW